MEAAVPSEVTAVLERSRELGFLGPQPVARQIEHALDFWRAIVASGLESSARILDLGSGGGLPGLVLIDRAHAASVALLDGSVPPLRLPRGVAHRTGHGDARPGPLRQG